MDKKFYEVVQKLLHAPLDDRFMAENIAAIYYDLHNQVHKDQKPYRPKRLLQLSPEDQELLSDIMEYFFYPDQIKIAREVFSTALVTTASKVLRSYAK